MTWACSEFRSVDGQAPKRSAAPVLRYALRASRASVRGMDLEQYSDGASNNLGSDPRLVRCATPYLRCKVVDPFEPPQAIELRETNAVVGVTKWPAIFQSLSLLVYEKCPVLSTGRL